MKNEIGTWVAVGVFGIACSTWGEQAARLQTVRYGAKCIRAEIGAVTTQPQVVVVGPAGAWQVKEGEAWTGVNGHEFYFTLETTEGDVAPPEVKVIWPGVEIARVLGASGTVSNVADGVSFRMVSRRAPTSVGTSLTEGAVHMHIFHNWEVRRAGHYREGTWPANIIQAQLNYLFAARELCRAMGYTDSADPGFKGDIRLYGFESNFPNGHVDHPPHFHIMLGWPGWTGTQAGHFLLDSNGRILENRLMADMGGRQEHALYRAGEVCPMRDPDGKIGFELIIEENGAGVIMRRASGQPEFRIHAGPGEAGAVGSVAVARRDVNRTDWTPLCNVRAADDAATGRMELVVTPVNGKETREVLTYDIDTGTLRPPAASAPASLP